MTPLHQLQALGQSVWYDNIRRALLDSGELARYVDELAVSGVTSNPTIFEHAIAGGDEYDAALQAGTQAGVTEPEALFWRLAVNDIQRAADVLAGVHRDTGGVDGYVSLELPPRLSRDARASVETAVDLAERVDRPNAMIKVPGTPQGVEAVEELIYRGVPVNVTLLFSVAQWQAVAEAHARGLERRLAEGLGLAVASVASFFVSRIDNLANQRLPDELANRLAVANSQLAYAAYRRWLDSERWQRLADAGALPQRLLWASTSAKDPRLAATHYVSALAAPDTVNTMPDDTLKAFAAHGEVGDAMGRDTTEAEKVVAAASEAGVDLAELGQELQADGEAKFAGSFDRLVATIRDKVDQLDAPPLLPRSHLEPIADEVAETLAELGQREAVVRLWKRDHTLWQDDPSEVADRLGWLSSPQELAEQADELAAFAATTAASGFTHALVLGMGGSSLFPLVAAGNLAPADGPLRVEVLDSIDPGAVRRVEAGLPLQRTLVVASSKSGTTAETRMLLDYFAQRVAPEQLVAITDPGSPLAELGAQRGFRRVFANRADLGGRYAALSHFGLVPAALAGVDVGELAHRGDRMTVACADCVPDDTHPALRLAAVLAGAARAGRDKLTLVVDQRVATFGWWLEQLVAESTGKHGLGIVPVVDEPLGPPEVYGDDRLFVGVGAPADALDDLAAAGHPTVHLPLREPLDVGAEVVRWEMAVALTGAALGINPFDQPDVEAAKQAARAALAGGVAEAEPQALGPLLDQLRPGDYLALQAYLDEADPRVAELRRARAVLRDRYGVATTLGLGPRYLHSTGQLHKGGPDTAVIVQAVAADEHDVAVPGQEFGLAALKRAQAAGDLSSLTARGRRAARVDLEQLLAVGR